MARRRAYCVFASILLLVVLGPACQSRVWRVGDVVEYHGARYVVIDDNAGTFFFCYLGPDAEAFEKAKTETIYFSSDRYEIRPEDVPTLEVIAQRLAGNPGRYVLIEGHGDELGTPEYNLGLGERRALAASKFLGDHGADMSQIKTISYGEERPIAAGHDEAAWAKNRRCELRVIDDRPHECLHDSNFWLRPVGRGSAKDPSLFDKTYQEGDVFVLRPYDEQVAGTTAEPK